MVRKHHKVHSQKTVFHKIDKMPAAYIFSKRLFDNYMREHGICDTNLPSDMAVVSIGELEESEHYFQDSTQVLNIDFWDVNDYEVEGVKGLTDEQAETIHDFISNNIGKDFYIHCRAGVSRSQAVARFLHDIHGYETISVAQNGAFPNQHVLSLLKKLHDKKPITDTQ